VGDLLRFPDRGPEAVSVWLHMEELDGTGRFLLLRRSQRVSNPGWWTFPGGRVEPGETPRAAAVRELQEETGLTVAPTDLVQWEDIGREDGRTYRVFVAYLLGTTPPSVILDTESDAATWVTVREAWSLPLHGGVELALSQLENEGG